MATKKIVYVGVDVDDTAFHGAGIILETGELFEFKCKPEHGVIRKKLNELFGDKYEIHLCYEACYLGYALYRILRKAGRHCEAVLCFTERDIIFPSMILFQAIGHFAKRFEIKKKSHLQANAVARTDKPYSTKNQIICIT
jgi:hypothetical protein